MAPEIKLVFQKWKTSYFVARHLTFGNNWRANNSRQTKGNFW
jgi:hypothetical protein